ncbi:MAG: heavy-metal-associated domain-containing protein [Burkholderiales bacterium]
MPRIFWASVAAFAIGIAHAAQAAQVTLDIPGMDCELCPITVTKALKGVPGVVDARAELSSKTAVVTYDPSRIAPAQLERAVTDAGYPAKARAP